MRDVDSCVRNLREDWGLEDPTGKSDAEFIKVINIMEEKVKELSARLNEYTLRIIKSDIKIQYLC